MSGTKPTGKKTSAGLTRRDCLKAGAAAGAAMMMPTIVPASALGRGGAVAPSERITLGAIGIGNRGEFDLELDAAGEGRPVRGHLRRPQGTARARQATR